MKEDNHAQEIYAIWIDHVNRIISFRKEDGFEPQAFSSQDERMQYALEKAQTVIAYNDFPSSQHLAFGSHD